jgi:hypothetical protein
VSIVFKPHPDNVFATDRLSDHTRRRAWDIWAVNGQAVIAESTPDALIDGFLRAAKDGGRLQPRRARGCSPAPGISPTGPTATTATSRSTATPETAAVCAAASPPATPRHAPAPDPAAPPGDNNSARAGLVGGHIGHRARKVRTCGVVDRAGLGPWALKSWGRSNPGGAQVLGALRSRGRRRRR